MSIPEEIEQLKTRLAQTTDAAVEAELLLLLLKKYAAINSYEIQDFIPRLASLAEILKSEEMQGWALFYTAVQQKQKGEYDASLQTAQRSLALFQQLGNSAGVAISYSHIGVAYYMQGKYAASLENNLAALKISNETGDKQGSANSYNNIGSVFYRQGDYPEALKNFFASLKLKEETGERYTLPASYGNIGNVYFSQGNYPEALKNHLAALKIQEENGDKFGIANSYHNLGSVYQNQGNFARALKSYFAGLKLKEELGDKRGVAISYNNIGSLYTEQKNYDKALKNHYTALNIRQALGDKYGIASSFSNIAINLTQQNKYAEALTNQLEALKLLQEIGDKYSIGVAHSHIGDIYQAQGNYDGALENFFITLKVMEEVKDSYGTALSQGNIGIVYQKQGRYKQSLDMLHKSAGIAKAAGAKDNLKKAYQELSKTYKAIAEFDNALEYYEKYHELENELMGEQTQKQLTSLNFKHNMEQKEKEAEINRLRNVELKGALDHLQIEKDRSESLLLNILPSEVAEELKQKGESEAKLFEDVTGPFTDFKGFTTISQKLTPRQLVNELHACFKAFDEIIDKYNIEKIKTVGDAYLAVGGLPLPNANHATDVVKAAIEIRDFIANRKKERDSQVLPLEEDLGGAGAAFEVRIGVHSGSVVAGIVGVKKFAYDIWGDTVNTAARMEQNSEAGKINISETTYHLVKDKFTCTYRGEIEAKNKGLLRMYYVEHSLK